jgi:DNA-binding MarR family transcriptional regulator
VEDSVDRHVARWQHWDEISFDDEVEAAVTRIGMLAKHLKRAAKQAAEEVGLHWFEYETLHALMIREVPGTATPTELADRLMVSPAGISGRLEGMEQAGLLRRVRSETDRRRVDVEITPEGRARWKSTMRLRGQAEEAMLGALSTGQRHTLNQLLRTMLSPLESD